MSRRLIESWLPIAALGEESVRERRSMTALPPTYYLHVWWARRPLVASRAAVLASLLPEDASPEMFLSTIGIHGDPVATRRRIDRARKTGEDLGLNPYGYERAFKYLPSKKEKAWVQSEIARLTPGDPTVLDPTAGGGSIPFESLRLGFATKANDLNPVAVLVQRCTYELPLKFGAALRPEFERIAKRFVDLAESRFDGLFAPEPEDAQVLSYLWARTVRCPHCEGLVPLSPNWRLAPNGTGVRLHPHQGTGVGDKARHVSFTIVSKAKEQSAGTVSGGDATCPFEDCVRLISGDYIKAEAQAGRMGEQLYTVAFKRKVFTGYTKAGKPKEKWVRGYRAPRPEDDVSALVKARLDEKMPDWEALDMVPTEVVAAGHKTEEPLRYGMKRWQDMFSPRQLLGHGTAVEVFREIIDEEKAAGRWNEVVSAAFAYLSLTLDKMLNYNSRMSVWMSTREVMANTFNRHDFAFCWSHAEMAPLIVGLGYDWAIEQTAKCIGELVELARPDVTAMPMAPDLFNAPIAGERFTPPPVTLTCKSGDSLDHIADASIDAVVMDPPYYDNVMYAELSDFFYVWLKRTAGYIYPEFFRRPLTDKENEAVANPAKFKGEKGAKALAGRDYQHRMAAIFTEMRRVLKPDGIITLMFTHKATGAWDALTKGLMEAGFAITASWPLNTEAEGSMHIKDKSAANSTVFLVCRPLNHQDTETRYWEDVEPKVRAAVRERIGAFQKGGIRGVDLYLSCFGPALEVFSQAWPLVRGTPRQDVEQTRRKRRQAEMFDEQYDPFAVSPEDALVAARAEVKNWRLSQLAHAKRNVELDNLTSWFVLAWDAFGAPVFPYDEANKLAKVCGVDMDRDVIGKLAEKKTSDVVLWDAVTRAAKGSLGLPDGRDSMMDALHHLAKTARGASLEAANELLAKHGLANEPAFLTALEAVLEVLPVGKAWSGFDLPDAATGAGADFDALENLRRLALAEKVAEPEQLKMWQEENSAQE
jgi:adenine-specific DNA methylase